MVEFIQQIQDLIGKGKQEQAFKVAEKYLNEHPEISSDAKQEFIALKSRYTILQKENRMGMMSSGDWIMNQNKINFSFLDLVNNLSIENLSGAEPETMLSYTKNMQNIMNVSQTTLGVPDLLPTKERQKILFLASNSNSIGRLRLEREFVEIHTRFQEFLENFELKQGGDNVNTRTIQDFLLKENPHILHLAGHGASSSTKEVTQGSLTTEEEREGGLVLKTPNGEDRIVETSVLEDLFDILADEPDFKLQIIVLNACFSKEQADVLCKHVPYVVGMKREINDNAAIEFSVGFYRGIAAGKSIETSFKLARNQMRLQGFEDDAEIPTLLKQPQA